MNEITQVFMVTTSKLININVNNVIFIIYISKRFNKIKITNIFDKLFCNLFEVLWICVYQFDFVFCRNKYEPHSELSDKNVRLSYRFIFSKIVSWSLLYILLLIITTNHPFLLCHGIQNSQICCRLLSLNITLAVFRLSLHKRFLKKQYYSKFELPTEN